MTFKGARKFLNGELMAVTITHSVSSAAQKKRLESKFAKFAALNLAIRAIDKQIPKKVKKEFVTVNGCITCFETDVCPVCGNDFYIEDLGQTMYYSFCPSCGQALDWGVTDN